MRYEAYIADKSREFREGYMAHCLDPISENFTAAFDANEYHYTLYYYDMAGNLVKTVPPEGVYPLTSSSDLAQVAAYRTYRSDLPQHAGATTPVSPIYPCHALPTHYMYNVSPATRQYPKARE